MRNTKHLKRRITGIELSGQIPLLEQVAHGHSRLWCLWLSYNVDRTAGTYLTMHDDGMVLRHTCSPTGETQSVVITPALKPVGQ